MNWRIVLLAATMACGLPWRCESQIARPSCGQIIGRPLLDIPCPVASFVGPMDAVTGAIMCFSLRACSGAIAAAGTQASVNLIRASDSHTCDILVATSGGLGNTANCSTMADNGQSASSFCNATTCNVTTWYDQSGASACSGACNATDGTVAARRPLFDFNCINTSLPCVEVVANATTGLTTAALGSSQSQQYVMAILDKVAVGAATTGLVIFNASIVGSYSDGANLQLIYAGTLSADVTASDGTFHAIQGIFNGASSSIYVDATANNGLSANTNATGANSLTLSNKNGVHYYETEMLFYPNTVTYGSTQATAMKNNMCAYWGTTC